MAGESDYPWFEVTESAELQQGDLLAHCPVFIFPAEASSKEWDGTLERAFHPVLVLTHSCDLVVRPPHERAAVSFVIVCPVFAKSQLDSAEHPDFGSRSKWNSAIKGNLVGWRVLNECTIPGHERELSAIDLRTIYTVPFDLAMRIASRKKRLRLRSPYREHIASAFAAQFARVGLPIDIPRL